MKLKANRRPNNEPATGLRANARAAWPSPFTSTVIMTAQCLAACLFGSVCPAANDPGTPDPATIYDRAIRDYKSGSRKEALEDLAAFDALATRAADKAESLNLRGAILTREGQYEAAEVALGRALEIEPKLWNARFNLAEIPFLKRDWAEARDRFETMLADLSDELEKDSRRLIEYKILLTYALEPNEEGAGRMLEQLEAEQDNPAPYFARAAIAWQHGAQQEAKDWIAAAKERFPAAANRLYAESFYEIGWKERPPNELREGFEIVLPDERLARGEAEAAADFHHAESALLCHRPDLALAFLERLGQRAPVLAASHNLRGEIFMGQKKFDEAESELQLALAADPQLREAAYNLAEVAFKRQRYGEARDRFEQLFSEIPGGSDNQAAELMEFKIFLTFLIEGRETEAQRMIGHFKFTGPTPALYYAQAAWAFHHANPEGGDDWVASAQKIYSPALNLIFADSFYDLGWLRLWPATIAGIPAEPRSVSPLEAFGSGMLLPGSCSR